MAQKKFTYLIGIDEAGRGPVAGPVVVAAVRVRRDNTARLFPGIRDSKKLSLRQREMWFSDITQHAAIVWAASVVSPAVIDRLNIRNATNRGALRAYRKIAGRGNACYVMLDGGLVLPKRIAQQAIIKGDERIPLIAAASVIAKVTRDRIMLRLHKRYPKYRFDLHKGYGTRLHGDRIRELGRCKIHRASFHFP